MNDIGAPVGLAALLTAQFYAPAEFIVIDIDDNRLQVARTLGATHTINNNDGSTVAQVMARTDGQGADVAIEAVGTFGTFDVCQSIVTAGGHVANWVDTAGEWTYGTFEIRSIAYNVTK